MINCHTHIFTINHVPKNFLPWHLKLIAKLFLSKRLIKLFRLVKLNRTADLLKRFLNFKKIGNQYSQEEIFKHLRGFYPEDTGFVTLSMDMEFMGAGKVVDSFDKQIMDLSQLKKKYQDKIYPFIFAHPERPNIYNLVKEYIENHHFAGIKIYPAIGYFPSDKRLHDVYAYAEKYQIPIITHCARGGVYYKGKLTKDRRTDPLSGETHKKLKKGKFTDIYSDPDRYEIILSKYPKLKLCFAHYGGSDEWDKFLNESWHENVPDTWFQKINTLIDTYENVYTDIRYTLVRSDLFPILKSYLNSKPELHERVLFGTDYYMTEQEGSERYFGMNLRGSLGEELWKQIAEKNPDEFLTNNIK